MPVSAVNQNPMLHQAVSKNSAAPRENGQLPAAVVADQPNIPALATPSKAVNLSMPTPHANRVGVAAYVAIMNPQISAMLRSEA